MDAQSLHAKYFKEGTAGFAVMFRFHQQYFDILRASSETFYLSPSDQPFAASKGRVPLALRWGFPYAN